MDRQAVGWSGREVLQASVDSLLPDTPGHSAQQMHVVCETVHQQGAGDEASDDGDQGERQHQQ